jgi:hypothetical protein
MLRFVTPNAQHLGHSNLSPFLGLPPRQSVAEVDDAAPGQS